LNIQKIYELGGFVHTLRIK